MNRTSTALRPLSIVLAITVACVPHARALAAESTHDRFCDLAYEMITDEAEAQHTKTKLVELLSVLPAAATAETFGKLVRNPTVDAHTRSYAIASLFGSGTNQAFDQLTAALASPETPPETKARITADFCRQSRLRRKDAPTFKAVFAEGPSGARIPAAILIGRLGQTGVRSQGSEASNGARPTTTAQRQTADGKNIGGKKIGTATANGNGQKADDGHGGGPYPENRQPNTENQAVLEVLLAACESRPRGIGLREVVAALGNARLAKALPKLFACLKSEDRMAAQAAWFGLMKTTLQDLPFESDPWDAWWKQNQASFQVPEVGPAVIPTLVKALDASKSHQYREQVGPLLADAGEEGLKLLTERTLKGRVIRASLDRLAEETEKVWPVAQKLMQEDQEVRATNAARLIRELQAIPTPDLKELLLAEKTDRQIREAAAAKLASAPTEEAVAALEAALELKDEKLREAVFRGVAQHPSAKLVGVYIKGLCAGSVSERAICESALGRLGKAVAPQLLACLADPEPEKLYSRAKQIIIEQLGRAKYTAATKALVTALKDVSPSVRMEAAEALDRLKVPLDCLLPLEEDASVAQRTAVANTLYRTGDAPVELVQRLANDRDATVREKAIRVIAKSPDPEHAATVLAAFKDSSSKVRIAAANAAESLKLEEARPALMDLASSSQAEASYAIQILGRLYGADILPFLLEQAQLDEEPQRSAGLTALGHINDARPVCG